MNFEQFVPGIGSVLMIVVPVVVVALGAIAIKCYKKCPSNMLLVVWGKGTGDSGTSIQKGGARLVVPGLQDYAFMSLSPINVPINMENAISAEKIRVKLPCSFTIGIGASEEHMANAASKLLHLDEHEIKANADNIITGGIRDVVAEMTIEEINANREKLLTRIQKQIDTELKKIGLQIINVNITDVEDEGGVIKAAGRKAAAEATNKANIAVAKQEREGEVGVAQELQEKEIEIAKADQLREVGVAEANTQASIGMAKAEQQRAVEVAQAEATQAEGQNEAEAKKAKSGAELKKAQAQAEQTTYEAETKKEEAREVSEAARKKADAVPEAEAAKAVLVIEAEAAKEQAELEGKGEGLRIRRRMEGEAEGIKDVLNAQAEGIKAMVEAAGGDAQAAIQIMMLDKIERLTEIQASAVKDIKIDKIVAMGGGDSTTGVKGLGNELMSMLPKLHETMAGAGVMLPGFLGSKVEEPSVEDGSDDEMILG